MIGIKAAIAVVAASTATHIFFTRVIEVMRVGNRSKDKRRASKEYHGGIKLGSSKETWYRNQENSRVLCGPDRSACDFSIRYLQWAHIVESWRAGCSWTPHVPEKTFRRCSITNWQICSCHRSLFVTFTVTYQIILRIATCSKGLGRTVIAENEMYSRRKVTEQAIV